jgi:hypothetical protein
MATNFRVTELDFDEIKTNIKNYLKSKPEFTDYDFEGSALSVLVDTLAYNTHYNAYYLNMAVNEVFIDSAVKRESIVSLAKMLNYTPRSVKGAVARLNITVNGVIGAPPFLIIDRYTAFTTTINSKTYSFYNLAPATITPSGSDYSYENLAVYEGRFVVNKFLVGASPGPSEKFVIENKNIDTDSLRVTVQPTATATESSTFTKYSGDITDVTGTSDIYFLEQNSLGFYEIYFGDGIIGTKLSSGNNVTVEYLVTSGSEANISDKIAQSFALSGSIQGYTDVSISVVQKSSGAQQQETADEIRFNATKYATSQNRLVTTADYVGFLKANYNYIDQAVVWGGEDNDPPQYGKVYMSILPKANQTLTASRRGQIVTDIKKKRSLGITPTFIDPEIFFIVIQDTVKYNPNLTNDSSSDIESAVRVAIQNYFTTNISKFGDDFSASKLVTTIDNAKTSIISNSMIPILEKRFNATPGVPLSQSFRIGNKIEPESITSTFFFFNPLQETNPIKSKIVDVKNTSPTIINGTYRRSGQIVTVNTPLAPHGLAAGEKVTLVFTGSSFDGIYTIIATPTEKSFTIQTAEEGVDYGSVNITSNKNGVLKVLDADTNRVLSNNVGRVSYDSGVVVINTLNIFGYLLDQPDLRLYFKMTRDSEDIFAERNQILRLDTDVSNEGVNRLGGISISTLAIPK